jgi:hypothetical protein
MARTFHPQDFDGAQEERGFLRLPGQVRQLSGDLLARSEEAKPANRWAGELPTDPQDRAENRVGACSVSQLRNHPRSRSVPPPPPIAAVFAPVFIRQDGFGTGALTGLRSGWIGSDIRQGDKRFRRQHRASPQVLGEAMGGASGERGEPPAATNGSDPVSAVSWRCGGVADALVHVSPKSWTVTKIVALTA